jgi:hypothetical protein
MGKRKAHGKRGKSAMDMKSPPENGRAGSKEQAY